MGPHNLTGKVAPLKRPNGGVVEQKGGGTKLEEVGGWQTKKKMTGEKNSQVLGVVDLGGGQKEVVKKREILKRGTPQGKKENA